MVTLNRTRLLQFIEFIDFLGTKTPQKFVKKLHTCEHTQNNNNNNTMDIDPTDILPLIDDDLVSCFVSSDDDDYCDDEDNNNNNTRITTNFPDVFFDGSLMFGDAVTATDDDDAAVTIIDGVSENGSSSSSSSESNEPWISSMIDEALQLLDTDFDLSELSDSFDFADTTVSSTTTSPEHHDKVLVSDDDGFDDDDFNKLLTSPEIPSFAGATTTPTTTTTATAINPNIITLFPDYDKPPPPPPSPSTTPTNQQDSLVNNIDRVPTNLNAANIQQNIKTLMHKCRAKTKTSLPKLLAQYKSKLENKRCRKSSCNTVLRSIYKWYDQNLNSFHRNKLFIEKLQEYQATIENDLKLVSRLIQTSEYV